MRKISGWRQVVSERNACALTVYHSLLSTSLLLVYLSEKEKAIGERNIFKTRLATVRLLLQDSY